MHIYGITYDDLAKSIGWSKGYVSMLLNGTRSTPGAREKIELHLNRMIEKKRGVKH